ncbi:conserved hypothetical protein [Hymenobacter roseosalivarius DSM 11622]|uniref:Chlorite dismutase n=2 Tax=Hymenobacter roseosalivarius TaxID=89967 RepID=A0A1W1W1E2_9BACT|nr:conserved hypothetical protein [Hymenobacter roseosalivarius DSM 11622]
MRAVAGEPLMPTSHLQLGPPAALAGNSGTWQLTGVMSNVRYAEKAERAALASVQAPLGRAEATCAALIPLRKSEAWWALAQDERRALFEQQSHHTQTRLAYLPAVARQLYHSRDLGEPFDFLTWFEYAPADEARFEELLTRLRSTPEWQYVDREIDIRLVRC